MIFLCVVWSSQGVPVIFSFIPLLPVLLYAVLLTKFPCLIAKTLICRVTLFRHWHVHQLTRINLLLVLNEWLIWPKATVSSSVVTDAQISHYCCSLLHIANQPGQWYIDSAFCCYSSLDRLRVWVFENEILKSTIVRAAKHIIKCACSTTYLQLSENTALLKSASLGQTLGNINLCKSKSQAPLGHPTSNVSQAIKNSSSDDRIIRWVAVHVGLTPQMSAIQHRLLEKYCVTWILTRLVRSLQSFIRLYYVVINRNTCLAFFLKKQYIQKTRHLPYSWNWDFH